MLYLEKFLRTCVRGRIMRDLSIWCFARSGVAKYEFLEIKKLQRIFLPSGRIWHYTARKVLYGPYSAIVFQPFKISSSVKV